MCVCSHILFRSLSFPLLAKRKDEWSVSLPQYTHEQVLLLDWYLSRLHTRRCQYGATLFILQFILIRTPLENRRWIGQRGETKKAMIAPYYRTAQTPIAFTMDNNNKQPTNKIHKRASLHSAMLASPPRLLFLAQLHK